MASLLFFFDAFENDYVPDAFTAIAGQIVSIFDDLKQRDEDAIDRFIDKALLVSKIMLRSSVKVGLSAATLGVLTSQNVGEVAKDISKEVSALEDKYLGELITGQKEERAIIEAFKGALSELPDRYKQAGGEARKPLIFIIDELDRCRPDFALEILERIKHFFLVRNVHFVFGLNWKQMEESVRYNYGSGIDAEVYLQKFLNIRLDFADKVSKYFDATTPQFVDLLFDKHGLD
jgi:hypothetical protein